MWGDAGDPFEAYLKIFNRKQITVIYRVQQKAIQTQYDIRIQTQPSLDNLIAENVSLGWNPQPQLMSHNSDK